MVYLPYFYVNDYLKIIKYLFFSIILISVILLLVFLFSKRVIIRDSEKLASYECGFQTFGDSRNSFDIQFYLVAIIFLVFDIEIAFIIPWATMLKYMNLLGFLFMYFFLIILILGFIYELKIGALNWNKNSFKDLLETKPLPTQWSKFTVMIVGNHYEISDFEIGNIFDFLNQSAYLLGLVAVVFIYLIRYLLQKQVFHLKDTVIVLLGIYVACLFEAIINPSNHFSAVMLYNELFIYDKYTELFLFLLNLTVVMLLCFSENYIEDLFAEFEYLIIFILYVIFINYNILSINLLTIFLTLEGSSLCLFILIAYTNNKWSSIESAMKYFIQSSFVAALFLFGQVLIYAIIPTLNLYDIHYIIDLLICNSVEDTDLYVFFQIRLYFLFAFLFIFSIFLFKLSMFPLHFWTPDVYDGAPLLTTSIMAILNKIVIFAVFMRTIFLFGFFPKIEDRNLAFISEWFPYQDFFLITGIGSIIIGSWSLLRQKTIKRFLAYSTINNMGFLFLGFAAVFMNAIMYEVYFDFNPDAHFIVLKYILFYFIIYMFFNLYFFIFLLTTYIRHPNEQKYNNIYFMSDFAGFYKKNRALTIYVIVILFAFTGLPPFVTFYTKLFMLRSILEILVTDISIYYLLIIILSSTIMSGYSYLKIAKTLIFEQDKENKIVISFLLSNKYLYGSLMVITPLLIPSFTWMSNILDIYGNNNIWALSLMLY